MSHIQLGESITYLIDVLHIQRWPSSREATVGQLADYLEVRPKTIYGWCVGRYCPRPATLAKLARFGAAQLGLERAWAYNLLYYGNYPQWVELLAALYPHPPDTLRHNLPHRFYLTCIGRAAELAALEQRLTHPGGRSYWKAWAAVVRASSPWNWPGAIWRTRPGGRSPRLRRP